MALPQLFARMICRLTSHRWPLDAGICERCEKICDHDVLAIDVRWQKGMCLECFSLVPPRKCVPADPGLPEINHAGNRVAFTTPLSFTDSANLPARDQ
jgi:ribosomal protein L40E